ncbi:hypothetical protein B0H14DRAFT_3158593 [Mycena olivaceomarginata]|nr:hypothetical protein B0H14DRAFT_3158593 [Mycena olivaceomarginata]
MCQSSWLLSIFAIWTDPGQNGSGFELTALSFFMALASGFTAYSSVCEPFQPPRCDKDRGVGIEMYMIRIDCVRPLEGKIQSDDSEEGRCTNPNQRWRYDGYRTDEDTDVVRTIVETIGLGGADGDLNLVASLRACFLQSDARENGDPNRGSLDMCGLPPAVNDGRRVHEGYEVGEGWEYPFRLSVSGTESGENAPRATSAGRELLTTPLNALPFIPLGAMRVAGGFRAKGRHEAFRGAFMAGGWPPLSRRPIVFGCGKGLTKPRNLRTRPELQARPGGRLGRRSSVQGEGETSGLPRLVDASCEAEEEAVPG